jgi:hypothetical protein
MFPEYYPARIFSNTAIPDSGVITMGEKLTESEIVPVSRNPDPVTMATIDSSRADLFVLSNFSTPTREAAAEGSA